MTVPMIPLLCEICIHNRGFKPGLLKIYCDAFPNGVPDEILMEKIKHVDPIDGDNGIVFEPRVRDDVKLNQIVQEVFEQTLKLNYKCKKGTKDPDTNECIEGQQEPNSDSNATNKIDVHKSDDKWKDIKGFRFPNNTKGIGRNDINDIKISDAGKGTMISAINSMDNAFTKLGIPNIRGISNFKYHEDHSDNVNMFLGIYGEMADGVLWINPDDIKMIYNRQGKKGIAEAFVTAFDESERYVRENYGKYDKMSIPEKMEYMKHSKIVDRYLESITKYRKGDDSLMPWSFSKETYGDSNAIMPRSVLDYFENADDRMKSIVYHEMAHHVHQLLDNADPSNGRTQFEAGLQKLYKEKRSTGFFPTAYSAKNGEEWFAENFSLHKMGRDDLVDDDMKGIFKKLDNGENPFRGDV